MENTGANDVGDGGATAGQPPQNGRTPSGDAQGKSTPVTAGPKTDSGSANSSAPRFSIEVTVGDFVTVSKLCILNSVGLAAIFVGLAFLVTGKGWGAFLLGAALLMAGVVAVIRANYHRCPMGRTISGEGNDESPEGGVDGGAARV